MRALRTIVLAGICAIAIVLSSGCDREKWTAGQGIRASVVMFPTTSENTVDPRLALGYYYYEMTNKEKAEFDFDFVPDLGAFDNNYMTLRADYLRIAGDTSLYYGGGGGIMFESKTTLHNSGAYFMVEAVIGYIWSIGSGENPFPFDIRLTAQELFGDLNANLVLMGTFNWEF